MDRSDLNSWNLVKTQTEKSVILIFILYVILANQNKFDWTRGLTESMFKFQASPEKARLGTKSNHETSWFLQKQNDNFKITKCRHFMSCADKKQKEQGGPKNRIWNNLRQTKRTKHKLKILQSLHNKTLCIY